MYPPHILTPRWTHTPVSAGCPSPLPPARTQPSALHLQPPGPTHCPRTRLPPRVFHCLCTACVLLARTTLCPTAHLSPCPSAWVHRAPQHAHHRAPLHAHPRIPFHRHPVRSTQAFLYPVMQTTPCTCISAPIAPTSCPSVRAPRAPWHPTPNWGHLCTLLHMCPKPHCMLAPSPVPHSPCPITCAPHIPGCHPPIAAPLCSILTHTLSHCTQTSHPIAHVAHPSLHMYPFQTHPLRPTTRTPIPHTCSPSAQHISPLPSPLYAHPTSHCSQPSQAHPSAPRHLTEP